MLRMKFLTVLQTLQLGDINCRLLDRMKRWNHQRSLMLHDVLWFFTWSVTSRSPQAEIWGQKVRETSSHMKYVKLDIPWNSVDCRIWEYRSSVENDVRKLSRSMCQKLSWNWLDTLIVYRQDTYIVFASIHICTKNKYSNGKTHTFRNKR